MMTNRNWIPRKFRIQNVQRRYSFSRVITFLHFTLYYSTKYSICSKPYLWNFKRLEMDNACLECEICREISFKPSRTPCCKTKVSFNYPCCKTKVIFNNPCCKTKVSFNYPCYKTKVSFNYPCWKTKVILITPVPQE